MPYCPREKGYCRKHNNWDQNSGEIKLNNIYSDTYEKQEECLALCLKYPGATGCNVVWGGALGLLTGCYVHTKDVSHGSGTDPGFSSICWVFSKCRNVLQ